MSGLFGLGDDQVSKPSIPFPIGENVSNVYLTKLVFKGDGDYGPQLEFHLQRKGDNPSSLIDYRSLPVEGKVFRPKGNTDSDKELFENAAMDFNAVVKNYAQMTGKFDEIQDEVKSQLGASEDPEEYAQIVEKVFNDILEKNHAGPCFVTTYKSDKGYARMSKYPPFIQLMAAAENPEGDLKYSTWEMKQNAKEVVTGTQDEDGNEVNLEEDDSSDDLTEFLD